MSVKGTVQPSMRPRIEHNKFVAAEPDTALQERHDGLVRSLDGRVMVKELHFVCGIVKELAWRPA